VTLRVLLSPSQPPRETANITVKRSRNRTELFERTISFSSFDSSHVAAVQTPRNHARQTDQKQTRSSTPGQTKKMTNVLMNVIVIAILTINGKGGAVVGSLADCWKEESSIILSVV